MLLCQWSEYCALKWKVSDSFASRSLGEGNAFPEPLKFRQHAEPHFIAVEIELNALKPLTFRSDRVNSQLFYSQ